jgi:CheY-like chemotaxis protein
MPLHQGEVRGYDFNRSVVEFTMLNQSNVILCAISTAAMDGLEGRRDVRPDQRVDQFMRLREVIEERASRKFFEEQVIPAKKATSTIPIVFFTAADPG